MKLEHIGQRIDQTFSIGLPEKKVGNFESERPIEMELPHVEEYGGVEVELLKWNEEDSERESVELPCLEISDIFDSEKCDIGWSDEIMDSIGSIEEYQIYKNAELVEVEISGKKCLICNEINWNQVDAMGRTNKERAEQGLSPINKDGKVIELHHIGQHADSPLAELTSEQHRGKGNDTILHDKTKESEIDRQAFASERSAHWEARANEGR